MTEASSVTPASGGMPDPRDISGKLDLYRTPSVRRSVLEILVTALPFAALWLLAWAALDVSYWLSLLFIVPAAGFLVRLFIIQHDCGHGALFRASPANDWVGRVLGVFTLTPFDTWRSAHATHHATSGNLAKRGIGDIKTLTVEEYRALSWRGRLAYRLYRHPFVMFVVGPAYVFVLRHRLPFGLMKKGWRPWISAMATNLGIAAVAALAIWLVGFGPFLMVQIPITLLAASIGVWLFYVQHQFETTHWAREGEWKMQKAALHGSSHYDLPAVLRWFTANIGIHHVHHLCARIPFYRLRQVLRDHPKLQALGRLTLWQSLRSMKLRLWDEAQRKLISFREFRDRYLPRRAAQAA